MKKMKLLGLAALFALGFGFMGCDSGNDEYVEEIPTTWVELDGSATSTVTAKWTFATDTSGIGTAETSWEGKEITPDSGEGATLVGGT